MDALAVQRSRGANRLEGFALSAMTAFPTFAGAAMLLKIVGSTAIVGDTGGAAVFAVMTSIISALIAMWLGPKYPRFFQASYEPLFFDASLSLKEKAMRWLAQPKAQQQLLVTTLMLAILGSALASFP